MMKIQYAATLLGVSLFCSACSDMEEGTIGDTGGTVSAGVVAAFGGSSASVSRGCSYGYIFGTMLDPFIVSLGNQQASDSGVKDRREYRTQKEYVLANFRQLDYRARQLDECCDVLQASIRKQQRGEKKIGVAEAEKYERHAAGLIVQVNIDLDTASKIQGDAVLKQKIATVRAKSVYLEKLAAAVKRSAEQE